MDFLLVLFVCRVCSDVAFAFGRLQMSHALVQFSLILLSVSLVFLCYFANVCCLLLLDSSYFVSANFIELFGTTICPHVPVRFFVRRGRLFCVTSVHLCRPGFACMHWRLFCSHHLYHLFALFCSCDVAGLCDCVLIFSDLLHEFLFLKSVFSRFCLFWPWSLR